MRWRSAAVGRRTRESFTPGCVSAPEKEPWPRRRREIQGVSVWTWPTGSMCGSACAPRIAPVIRAVRGSRGLRDSRYVSMSTGPRSRTCRRVRAIAGRAYRTYAGSLSIRCVRRPPARSMSMGTTRDDSVALGVDGSCEACGSLLPWSACTRGGITGRECGSGSRSARGGPAPERVAVWRSSRWRSGRGGETGRHVWGVVDGGSDGDPFRPCARVVYPGESPPCAAGVQHVVTTASKATESHPMYGPGDLSVCPAVTSEDPSPDRDGCRTRK